MLCPPTCVGLRYGHQDSSLRGFSWKHGITGFVRRTSRHRISAFGMEERIYLLLPPTCLNPDVQHRARLPFSVPPSVKRCPSGTGIINPFPIAYAVRPRLRGRLTLSRLALPRKPWVYGEQVSHLFYRYSCPHRHFQPLQPSSRLTFSGDWNAPLPPPAPEGEDDPQLRWHA